jgi:hypothetical protein
MVQLPPSSAWDGKEDAGCVIMFILVCLSKFSNLTRSCSNDMVQHASDIAWHCRQHSTDNIMFVFACLSKFGNLASSCPIEMIQLGQCTAWHGEQDNLMTSCLALLVYLNLVTSADHAQLGWLNLQPVVTWDSE